MLQRHVPKGRPAYVAGKLQTLRRKKCGEDPEQFSTEVLLVPPDRAQFLEEPVGNGAATQCDSNMAASASESGDPLRQSGIVARRAPSGDLAPVGSYPP